MKIVVIGMGYVDLSNSMLLAQHNTSDWCGYFPRT
jgi:UDP-glucose 6-dehydrogenase